MEWTKNVKIEDLPGPYKMIASVVGLDNTIELSKFLSGVSYYYPKLDTVIRKAKKDYIKTHFTGANHRELAAATGYSEVWIYKILRTLNPSNG